MSMNIYSQKGDRVIYNNPRNGYQHDQNKAAKYLTVGQTYTVAHTLVDSFSTTVWLNEVTGVGFNSVLFSDSPKISTKNKHRLTKLAAFDPDAYSKVQEGTVYIGELSVMPALGKKIILAVDTINGHKQIGDEALITSTVVRISGNNYHTRNSIYRLELYTE